MSSPSDLDSLSNPVHDPSDRISQLPLEIIHEILSRIHVKDATRTSILSRIWRHKWMSMPDLNFDHTRRKYRSGDKVADAVNQYLPLHQGSIRKFGFVFLKNSHYVDPWISFLSRHPVEELRISFIGQHGSRFPLSLFDFKKLTHLSLRHCKLYIPPSFKGFLHLKALLLGSVELDSSIESIVSVYSSLESLRLYDCVSQEHVITISAPKLNYFEVSGDIYKDIRLNNVHGLVTLRYNVDLSEQRHCNLITGTNRVETLFVRHFTKYIGRLATQFGHLKEINLEQVRLFDREEAAYLLKALTSAPNLEILHLQLFTICHKTYDRCPTNIKLAYRLWPADHPQGRDFQKLREIMISQSKCAHYEIEFAEFMIRNSPLLEKIHVQSFEERWWVIRYILRKVRKLQALTQAEVILKHRWGEGRRRK